MAGGFIVGTFRRGRQLEDCVAALAEARDYHEWLQAAREFDHLTGADEWRAQDASPDYDHALLRDRLKLIRRLRDSGRASELMYELSQGLHWNLGNSGNVSLYQQSLVGTKHLIEVYLNEVCTSLNWLCDNRLPGISLARRRKFFQDTAQSFGRSGLMLSGGATMGLFHVGVVRTLYLNNLLPDVISGSSAGALVGAAIATRTPEDADRLVDPDNMYVDLWGLLPLGEAMRRGGLMDQHKLRHGLAQNILDLTFSEAYEASGIALNITVSPVAENQPARLLNHLTFPHLYIRDAVLASCAVPLLFPPVHLTTRTHDGRRQRYMPSLRWADGSLKSDLPRLRLRRLFNVNHFVVSQTNPHVLPFLSEKDPNAPGVWHGLRQIALGTVRNQARGALHMAHVNMPRPMGQVRRGLQHIKSILEQDYRGNITIIPDFDWRNYARVIGNPNASDVARMIHQGERATWPKLAMIRHQTQVSQTLADCLERLNVGRGSPLRGRQDVVQAG